MPDEDASLTDFLPEDGESSASDDDDREPSDLDEEGSGAGVEPAVATATWTPDGGACADCGAAVERRWSDGEGLVCGDCKDWSRSDSGGRAPPG